MEQNLKKRKRGINARTLRLWGIVFAFAGIIGRGVIQAHMLGIVGDGTQDLLNILDTKPNAMMLTAFSIAMQAAETCAVPIFAMLLIEGMQNTSNFKAYFLRVATLAVVCEIPFNMALSAKLFDLKTRNPVFGVLICMFMLYLWGNYSVKSKKNTLIKFLIVIVAILWCEMLKIDFGSALVIIVAILWVFRNNTLFFNFAGAAAAMSCTLISPFFLASPMGFLVVHSYNGDEDTNSHKYNYLLYPVLLIIGWAFGILLKQ